MDAADSSSGRRLWASATSALLLAVATCLLAATPGEAAVPHVVQPGETLSGVAAANGLSTATLASWNGLDAEAGLIAGSSIQVPSTAEAGGGTTTASTGASAGGGHTVVAGETLSSIAAANGVTVSELAAPNGLDPSGLLLVGQVLQIPAPSAGTAAPASWLGAISSPWGDLYLEASAAQAWEAMRQRSLADYGQDLYPAGSVSAYRTVGQQGDLYESFLSGVGAPANPPGGSSHELGLSVDLATPEMRNVVDLIGSAYGWGKLEAPDEWWHVTYGGG